MSIRCGLIAAGVVLVFVGPVLADVGPPGPDGRVRDGRAAFYTAAAVCAGVAILFELALKVIVIWYILRDSRKRGTDPTIWVILAIFAEVIALIVYLCVRPPLNGSGERPRVSGPRDL